MQSNIIQYNFPFKRIEDYLNNSIEPELEKFYNSNIFAFEHRIKEINKTKQIISIYKDCYEEGEIEFETYSFENSIKHILINLITESLDVITNGINSCFPSSSATIDYLNKVNLQYDNLKKNDKTKDFIFLLDYFKEIEIYLNKSFQTLNGKENSSLTSSSFTPHKRRLILKSNFSIRTFTNCLHEILSDNGLIDDYFMTQEKFHDILTNPDTNNKLQFICKNYLIKSFFESIKSIFIDFNASLIESSELFNTEGGTPLNGSNYNRTKEKPNDPKVIKIQKEISDLILEYPE